MRRAVRIVYHICTGALRYLRSKLPFLFFLGSYAPVVHLIHEDIFLDAWVRYVEMLGEMGDQAIDFRVHLVIHHVFYVSLYYTLLGTLVFCVWIVLGVFEDEIKSLAERPLPFETREAGEAGAHDERRGAITEVER